jgi:hypothetical protein
METTSAGSHTVKGRFSLNSPYGTAKIDARMLVALWLPTSPTVSINASSPSITLGQSVVFTSTVSGGSSPYTYQWYLNSTPVLGATSDNWTYTPAVTGSDDVYLKVTDSVPITADSNVITITVLPAPLLMPQLRVEIYPRPGFADDNFLKGWSLVTAPTSSYSSDGDLVTINVGDQAYGLIEKDLPGPLSTNTYPRIQFRVSENNGTFYVYLYDGVALSWTIISSGSDLGLKDIAIPAGIYTKIRIGGRFNDTTVKFDYVFISKAAMSIPTDDEDVINDVTITLPLLENGVSGAELTFPNLSGEYTSIISSFDRIIIYLWRENDTMKKVFGGGITDVLPSGSEKQGDFYIKLTCMDLGNQLHAPDGATLFQEIYVAENGRTIIKDIIDASCSKLTRDFVDVGEELESTHDLNLDEIIPYGTINEVCKKATTAGGVIGFDSYVDPAGNVHVFKRNKYTSAVDISEFLDYEHPIDSHQIRNRIKVYGLLNYFHPSDDSWTESTTDWTGDAIDLSPYKQVGTYSIEGSKAGSEENRTSLEMIRSNLGGVDCGEFRDQYQKLKFQFAWSNVVTYEPPVYYDPWYMEVYLYHSDTHYVMATVQGFPKIEQWQTVELPLGRDETAADYSKTWKSWGDWEPDDWESIVKIKFVIWWEQIPGGYGYLWIDDLRFVRRFVGLAFDSVSIAKYGDRWAEPQEDDELASDDECVKKAQSLIDFLSEDLESLSITVDGDNRFTQGDKQRVVIANDSIDAYYRILEVKHTVTGPTWLSILKLANSPKMIDYITASAGGPRNAGCTVVVPRDFTTLREAVNAVVI